MDELNVTLSACRNGKVNLVKFQVENNIELARKKDAENNTALHVACDNGLSIRGIECLYSAYPDALTMFNDEGASPFHLACSQGESIENLQFLQSKLPIGLVTANEKGDVPLHWIDEKATEELIKYLLKQFPKCAGVKNKGGALPIHVACNKGSSLNVIRLLHQAHPAGILQQDTHGLLPIHDACDGNPNLKLMQFFNDVSPESFGTTDNLGNLALHFAVHSSPEVVQFIVETNKLALQTPNDAGYLPIHEACSLSVDLRVVNILLKNYPEGVKAKTSNGHLPFHLAIPNLSMLTYLYELFNESVKTPDRKGRYPLHIACAKGASLNIISFIAEKYPFAAQEVDHSQMLPLHHAIISNAPLSTIKYLIEFHPRSLHCADANHHLPFHLVFLHSNNLEVLHLLRTDYVEEFEQLIVHPACKKECNSTSSLSQNSQSGTFHLPPSDAENMTESVSYLDSVQGNKEQIQNEKEHDTTRDLVEIKDLIFEDGENENSLSNSQIEAPAEVSQSEFDYNTNCGSCCSYKEEDQTDKNSPSLLQNIQHEAFHLQLNDAENMTQKFSYLDSVQGNREQAQNEKDYDITSDLVENKNLIVEDSELDNFPPDSQIETPVEVSKRGLQNNEFDRNSHCDSFSSAREVHQVQSATPCPFATKLEIQNKTEREKLKRAAHEIPRLKFAFPSEAYEADSVRNDRKTNKRCKKGNPTENISHCNDNGANATTIQPEDDEPVFRCVCGAIHDDPDFMIQCDQCQSWYDVSEICAGFSEEYASTLPSWTCVNCV